MELSENVNYQKDRIFSLLRAWDKEKLWVPNGNRTHDLPYTSWAL